MEDRKYKNIFMGFDFGFTGTAVYSQFYFLF